MALIRWFLRAVSTQIVGQSDGGEGDHGGCRREAKGTVRMVERRDDQKTLCQRANGRTVVGYGGGGFRMPLHYPRYRKEEYEKMEEWKLDVLLGEYGLTFDGSLEEKRAYAIGAFIWPDQL